MALLWIEGFEAFGVTNGNAPVGLQAKYASASSDGSFLVEAGRVAGKSMRLTSGSIFFETNGFGNVSTMVVGFGFYQDAFASAQDILYFYDGTTRQGVLQVQTDGKFKYYKSNSSTTALGTTSSGASASTWLYLEIKVKFHGSTGTVDILINGSSVLSLTSQNTDQSGNTRAQRVRFCGATGGGDHTQFDDIYILDTTGSNNNAPLGPQIVKMIVPASDAGTNAYTPDSGSNHYDRLTENPQDTTSYLADDTTGHRELFVMGNLNMATIAGVQMNAVAAITDNTIYSIKNSTHTSGGTDTDQAAVAIADTNYQTVSNVLETNPETSALWHQAGVNGCQFGFKTG